MTICKCCFQNKADQKHHKFSQTKWARRLYGKLLDDPRNLMDVCHDCHASHASPDLIHWDEARFCEEIGVEVRSKVGRFHGKEM